MRCISPAAFSACLLRNPRGESESSVRVQGTFGSHFRVLTASLLSEGQALNAGKPMRFGVLLEIAEISLGLYKNAYCLVY